MQRDTAELAAEVAYVDACESVGLPVPADVAALIGAAVAYMRTALGYLRPAGELVGLIRHVRDVQPLTLSSPADFLSTDDDGTLAPLVWWLRKDIDHHDDQSLAGPPLSPSDRDDALWMIARLAGTIALPTAGAALLVWCLTETQKLRAMIGGKA